MIAYQEYNTKSPLNGLAAKWAAQNPQLLPVDPQPVAPPLAQQSEVAIEPPPPKTVPNAGPSLQAETAAPECDPWSGKIIIS
jgi:hypothetical protein